MTVRFTPGRVGAVVFVLALAPSYLLERHLELAGTVDSIGWAYTAYVAVTYSLLAACVAGASAAALMRRRPS